MDQSSRTSRKDGSTKPQPNGKDQVYAGLERRILDRINSLAGNLPNERRTDIEAYVRKTMKK